jgi:hypothetical protein
MPEVVMDGFGDNYVFLWTQKRKRGKAEIRDDESRK